MCMRRAWVWLGLVGLVAVAGCAGARAVQRGAGVRASAAGPRDAPVAHPCLLSIRGDDGASCGDPERASAGVEAIFDERAGTAPQAVGAFLRARAPEPEQCTATLVAPTLVVTASHCLRPRDRVQGGGCDDTWIVLPAADDRPRESIACAGVVYATTLLTEDALEPDVALLRLARATSRVPLALDASALAEGTIVSVASVTPHPIYATVHHREARLCRVMEPARATSALGPAAATVGWLEGCRIEVGNSGSPVIDPSSAVRAIVHGGARGGIGVMTPVTPALMRALERARDTPQH